MEFTVLLIKMFLNTNAGLLLLLLLDCECLFILRLWKKIGELIWSYRHSCKEKVTSELFVHFSENLLQDSSSTGPVRKVLMTSMNWFCTDLLNLRFSSIFFLIKKLKLDILFPLCMKKPSPICHFLISVVEMRWRRVR